MKVVLISQDFYPLKGGIAKYLLEVYKKYFSDIEFEVIIPNYIGPRSKLNKLPFRVYQTEFFPFDLGLRRKRANNHIIKILDKCKPDVILFGYLRSHPEVAEMYKKKIKSVKWGILMHGKEAIIDSYIRNKNNFRGSQKGYTEKEANFYKNLINDADFVFAVSNFTKNLLLKQGIKREIIVVYPPLSTNYIKPIKDAKEKLSLGNKKIILSVGRLIKRKGQDRVIKVMPSLITEFPDLKYLIVGDGKEKERLNGLIQKNSLSKNVEILDKVEDKELPLFYSACDLFILPCKFIRPNDIEGFGIVFIEAGLYGKPVIGGNTGGVNEAIVDSKTGFLIDPNSEKQIMDKIKLLLKDASLRKLLGLNGEIRAKNLFNNKKSDYLINIISKDTSLG
jgi:phosphatidylinositol alpha-1,6-mannosyltransferase